jgi:hypothetical protein
MVPVGRNCEEINILYTCVSDFCVFVVVVRFVVGWLDVGLGLLG